MAFKPQTSSSKDKDGSKKAQQMTALTERFREEFKLSKPESVIQAYACVMTGQSRGELFISQNYLCYNPGLKRIPFSKVINIELSGPHLARVVTVKTSAGENQAETHTFHSFLLKLAKEAYVLAMHLWKNPPTYLDIKVMLEDQQKESQPPKNGNTTTGTRTTATTNTAGRPPASTPTQSQVQVKKPEVDTASADMLLSIALETSQMQQNIMETAAAQSEQIRRIEDKVENINANLRKADHLMKGIESLPYYMFGGSAKNSLRDKRAQQLAQKANQNPKGAPPLFEVEVVHKKYNDSLHPAILILETKVFRCVDPDTNESMEKSDSWKYEDIESIVMRARHEHMDIRFRPKGRLRLMSSYLQVITNQLYLRTKASNTKIEVIFEPGVQKFEYTDDRISKLPPKVRDPKGGTTVAIRNLPKTGDLFTDQKVRDDMNYVDSRLDEVHDITVAMKENALELDKQFKEDIEVLDRIDGKVDEAISRTQNLNRRIDKQVDD